MKTALTFLILALTFNVGLSQTNIISVKSGNWNDVTTWNTQTIPALNNSVIISAGDSVAVDSTAQCADITINSGSILISDSASNLSVSGNWNNSGSYIASKGNILFEGTTIQIISGTSVTTFYRLVINNPFGIDVNSNLNIKDLLTINQGTLSTSGFKLTLLSDSVSTAAIAPIASGADISGKITVQRYLSSNITGWRFLGSPVRTTLQDWSADFVTSGFPGSAYPGYYFCSIYSYDETVGGTSVNGYVMPTNVTDSILPGAGYWCWVGPTPSVVEVTGVPGKFEQNFNVSLTPDAGKNEDGWNMIANPYPSSIDWDSPSWSKTGIQDAVYVWDPELEQYSTYINGSGINGGTNVIPSSRAFWVQANQNSPVLACNENVKTSANATFLRSSNDPAIKLKLSGNNYTDETVVFLSPAASASVLAFEDAKKLFSDNPLVPSITSVIESTELAINSMPLNDALVIPVKVKVGVSGVYTLKTEQDFSLALNSCIFLEDLLTGSFINLRSAVSYSFLINDTTSAPRFLIHVTKPLIKSSLDATCSYKQNGMAIAKVNEPGNWSFKWKDELGNTLTEHVKSNIPDTLKNLAPGQYFIVAESQNSHCPRLQEEIIVNRPDELSVKMNVKNNNCGKENKGELGIALVAGGSVPYYYNWSNGKTTMVVQNLPSGVYTLVLSDAKGCQDTTYHVIKTNSSLKTAFEIENDTTDMYVNQVIVFNDRSIGAGALNWNFGDAVAHIGNPVHVFKTAGAHTIELTASDNMCSSTVQKIVNIKDPVKPVVTVTEPEDPISIYNLGEEASVKFNLDSSSPSTISVYALDGKIISMQNFLSWQNTETVKLGESHGLYMVRVQTNKSDITKKIIK